MRIASLPPSRRVWIFDLDNTLYPADCNLFAQVDQKMGEFISRYLGVPFVYARHLQKTYYRQFGTTLCGLMKVHRMDPKPFLDYVHEVERAADRLQQLEKAIDDAITAAPIQIQEVVKALLELPSALRHVSVRGIVVPGDYHKAYAGAGERGFHPAEAGNVGLRRGEVARGGTRQRHQPDGGGRRHR